MVLRLKERTLKFCSPKTTIYFAKWVLVVSWAIKPVYIIPHQDTHIEKFQLDHYDTIYIIHKQDEMRCNEHRYIVLLQLCRYFHIIMTVTVDTIFSYISQLKKLVSLFTYIFLDIVLENISKTNFIGMKKQM
jgi:hypothetical protein